MRTHSQRERALRTNNLEHRRLLDARDNEIESWTSPSDRRKARDEYIGSNIAMLPVDKHGRPIEKDKNDFSPFSGSVQYGLTEHCGIYRTEYDKPHIGEWQKPLKTTVTKPIGDLFTQDLVPKLSKVTISPKSNANTTITAAQWAKRGRAVNREARKFKAVITGQMLARGTKADRLVTDNSALLEANERTAMDHRQYMTAKPTDAGADRKREALIRARAQLAMERAQA